MKNSFAFIALITSVLLLPRPALGQESAVKGDALAPGHALLEGLVLREGVPVAGALVRSSAGSEAVTDCRGHYRLEVQVSPEAEHLVLLASDGGGQASATTSLLAPDGMHPQSVSPLELTATESCSAQWIPTFGNAYDPF